MSFFTSITCSIIDVAEETTSAEGVPVFTIKAVNEVCKPGIPVLLMVDQATENGQFLKALADKTKDKQLVRVQATGVFQPVVAKKSEDKKSIVKGPKCIVYVASARRMRADKKLDPEQAIVMGAGYSSPVTDFEDVSKRKPELFLSSGNENLQEAGKYASQMHVLADASAKHVAELFKQVGEGTEVYFVGNLFRSKGEMNGTGYDKLKVSSIFAQETERVRSRNSGKQSKQVSMRGQLDDSFEEEESVATTMSTEQLANQALVSLADF